LDIDPFSHAFLTHPYPGYDQIRERFAAEAETRFSPMRWAWTRRGAANRDAQAAAFNASLGTAHLILYKK
jgi:hypothetical protein